MDPLPFFNPPAESVASNPDLAQRYPLAFLSPPARNFLNSSFANMKRFRDLEGEPRLEMHSADAAARGIADGDKVRVFNDRGNYTLRRACQRQAAPRRRRRAVGLVEKTRARRAQRQQRDLAADRRSRRRGDRSTTASSRSRRLEPADSASLGRDVSREHPERPGSRDWAQFKRLARFLLPYRLQGGVGDRCTARRRRCVLAFGQGLRSVIDTGFASADPSVLGPRALRRDRALDRARCRDVCALLPDDEHRRAGGRRHPARGVRSHSSPSRRDISRPCAPAK
jgi:hypothetical protein